MTTNKKPIIYIIVGAAVFLAVFFVWRSTVLVAPDQTNSATPPVSGECGIENCHGLDIVCGPNPAEMCTMIYQLGDKCRQFARCGVIDGVCQQIENPQFTACKSCVQQCEQDFPSDPVKAFECESACGEEDNFKEDLIK